METKQQNDPADLLDMVIGELETELPLSSPGVDPTTCRSWYCV